MTTPYANLTLTPLRAGAILLLEGLASAGVQMLVIRQVTPFVGQSILTTSIVVSLFLAFLALGYFVGGQIPAVQYRQRLVKNLCFALGFLVIGLAYPTTHWFFKSLADSEIGILTESLVQLTIYATLIMGPLVFLLAQTVPLLLHTSHSSISKSKAAGNLTAISTVGNVFGCLFSSLILMVVLGVGAAIWINGLLLALTLVLLLSREDWQPAGRGLRTSLGALSIIAILALGFALNLTAEKSLFDQTTPYGNLSVVDRGDQKVMLVNRQQASAIDTDGAGFPYIETMKRAISEHLASRLTNGSDVLVLGAGGFTLGEGKNTLTAANAEITYVDVDPALKPLAEAKLLGHSINGQFIVDDARHFLLTSNKRFEVIVSDLYTNAGSIPAHTGTITFFELIESRLSDTGLAVFNIVANPTMRDKYSQRIDATIRSAFKAGCVTQLDRYHDNLENIIFLCRPETANQAIMVYTDDKAGFTLDAWAAANQAGNHVSQR